MELEEDISMFMTSVGLYYIFVLFLWKRNAITVLLQDLQDYNDFGKPHNIDKLNDSFNLYTKVYYYYCAASVFLYGIISQTSGARQCKERNEKYGRDEVCGFIAPLWLPFNYNYTPIYEILMIVQLMFGLNAAAVLMISFMIFVIVQHICCKIKHLKGSVAEIFSSQDPAIQRKRLINVIRYHQYIIRYSAIEVT